MPQVLIVDDSLTVRMDLSDALEGAGFTATLCATLAAARSALMVSTFDLLILDVVLPDGDGIEFLRALRNDPNLQATPAMILSSEAEVGDRARGLTSGANEYVGKPYNASYVVSRAHELVHDPREIPALASATVLLIDDSATYRETLKEALEAEGYVVTTAVSGDDGLRITATLRPHAVMVDRVLPGIDGTMVVRRIRMDVALRRTPCLLLTGSDDRRDELEALEAGADAFVRKDADTGVILARLAAVLRGVGEPSFTPATPSSEGPKKILAVDDSPTFLEATADLLRRDGYDVLLARSGKLALELLQVQRVDCVLLDLVMPEMSGQDTCRRIRNVPAWRDIPIILLTGMNARESMIEGMNAGADDYISKSSDYEVLSARLRAQIRRRQFEEENRQIREELLRKELEAAEARAIRELADTRAKLLADQEQTNRELKRAKERAERESLFKSRFLTNMSHELRTPLNAILGFSELLEQQLAGPLNETQSDFVQQVLASGRHLLALVNDVLDLAKVEAGRDELSLERGSLRTIITSVQNVTQSIANKRGVALAVSVPLDAGEVNWDPVRMKQVLYNLLSNGIKFTPPGGSVGLSVHISNSEARMVVQDTGVGVRPEDLPRLFREFERIDGGATDRVEGTGLGLTLAKRYIEMHGGRITVESEVGKGTAFTVVVPLG